MCLTADRREGVEQDWSWNLSISCIREEVLGGEKQESHQVGGGPKVQKKVLSEVSFQTSKGPANILMVLTIIVVWLILPTLNLYILSQPDKEMNYWLKSLIPVFKSLDSYYNQNKYFERVE